MKPGRHSNFPVWTAIVLDREAPARTGGDAASLGGVGSPWPWAVLAWAVLLAAIVVSFRPAVPVIWGDTPSLWNLRFSRSRPEGRPWRVGAIRATRRSWP